MIKEYLKRGALSFAIASFSGLLVNFIIDIIVNALGYKDFCSISPYFLALFPTTALAAYTNVLLYGLIGATFAVSTIVYEMGQDRICDPKYPLLSDHRSSMPCDHNNPLAITASPRRPDLHFGRLRNDACDHDHHRL